MLGVVPARLGVVLLGQAGVAVRAMGMMSGLFVIAGFVMLGGLAMVLCSMFVMLGSLMMMMLNAFVVAHDYLPVCSY
jgi:hypothetical protein